jgi:hypothetical protein
MEVWLEWTRLTYRNLALEVLLYFTHVVGTDFDRISIPAATMKDREPKAKP